MISGLFMETLKGCVQFLPGILPLHEQAKQANILVNDLGAARIADFGLMTITDLTTTFLSETDDSSGGTFCRMSPELLDPDRFGSNGRPTPESDCYALGMVIYEVSRLGLAHHGPSLTHIRSWLVCDHSIMYTPARQFQLSYEGCAQRNPLTPNP